MGNFIPRDQARRLGRYVLDDADETHNFIKTPPLSSR